MENLKIKSICNEIEREYIDFYQEEILMSYPIGSVIKTIVLDGKIENVYTPVTEKTWRFTGADKVYTQIKTSDIDWSIE